MGFMDWIFNKRKEQDWVAAYQFSTFEAVGFASHEIAVVEKEIPSLAEPDNWLFGIGCSFD